MGFFNVVTKQFKYFLLKHVLLSFSFDSHFIIYLLSITLAYKNKEVRKTTKHDYRIRAGENISPQPYEHYSREKFRNFFNFQYKNLYF